MPKIIQYQLSVMWIHTTYFHTNPDVLKLLLTLLAYNACWVCHRLHLPADCIPSLLRQLALDASRGGASLQKIRETHA